CSRDTVYIFLCGATGGDDRGRPCSVESPPVTAGPTPTPLPPPGRVLSSTALPEVPAAALWESAARQQHITYAEAVSGSPVPTKINLSYFLGSRLQSTE
ncbi:hypothetical protein J6590_029369, partial [Homalodisca vitripennis]